ncbi:MAG: hypothetical protein HYS88_00075 [Candidatus Colwellbacteria bacterium]|nr:hypothetical protein [Candidatus Colwellbacteria bacterium]
MEDFTPLIHALKILFETGIDFAKALIEVVIELFQVIIALIKSGLSLLP